ncbi:MAG: SLC13 family permease [Actinomycetia bacterium]|nr:SLC13 family permease [Actinomycetes bacterium]MCP4222003.1 SLC13 family permease [Actinomycetes bacterium]
MTTLTCTPTNSSRPTGSPESGRVAVVGSDPQSGRNTARKSIGTGLWRDSLAANRRPIMVATIMAAGVTVAPIGLPLVAGLTMALFAVLVVLTSFSSFSEPIICGAVLLGLVIVGASSVGDAVGATTGGIVWLLLGSFVIAGAVRVSGLAERMALSLGRRATTVHGLFWLVSAGVMATAFLVPSTAGRATLLLPVYIAIADWLPSSAARRALSLLIPSVVLLSALATLFGAGANLVTAELLVSMGNQPIDLVQWTLYGFPFVVASTILTTFVILRLFMSADDRRAPVEVKAPSGPWTRSSRIVVGVVVVMIALWLSEPFHGVSPGVVAMAGAGVVLVGPLRLITLAEARKAIPLDLLVLLIVTAEAGAALARTGAADWIANSLLGPVMNGQSSTLTVVAVVATVSLVAHIVITSRTARASVLIPVVVIAAGAAGLDPRGLAFLATAAVGYCMTTTTSAKPIRVFADVDEGYTPSDLRKLSAWLIPLHFILLLGFAFVAWPALGLPIQSSSAEVTVDDGDGHARDSWFDLSIVDLGVNSVSRMAERP